MARQINLTSRAKDGSRRQSNVKTNKITRCTRTGRELLLITLSVILALATLVECGGNKGKGKGGNQEDIIMYNGNIVMRGDESGGSIVMAGMHPTHEEVEFSSSFFTSADGEMGGFGRLRRR